jgi:hypothetical protein
MKPLGSLALPTERLGHRIITEPGHLVVIPLVQTHTGTVKQIDGGDDLHGAKQGAIHPAGARSVERRPLKNSHELRLIFQGKTFFQQQKILNSYSHQQE